MQLIRTIWAVIKAILIRTYVFVVFPILIIVGFYGIFLFIESPIVTQVFGQIFDFIFR